MQTNPPELVYKILTAEVWSAATRGDSVPSMPIDVSDGFLHLSTAAQLAETLALHFKGQSGLTVLAIRTADIATALRWEPSRGGELFPHVYGDVPTSAVATEMSIDVAADGSCDLPPEGR